MMNNIGGFKFNQNTLKLQPDKRGSKPEPEAQKNETISRSYDAEKLKTFDEEQKNQGKNFLG